MTLKELLEIAKMQLRPLTKVDNPDFRLEQSEFNEDESVWEIIVSYLVENINKRTHPLATLSPDFQYHRIYKKVKIRRNGELVGFYIHNNKE